MMRLMDIQVNARIMISNTITNKMPSLIVIFRCPSSLFGSVGISVMEGGGAVIGALERYDGM